MTFSSKLSNQGTKTQFWNDLWTGNEKLRIKYPRLYELDKKKSYTYFFQFTSKNQKEGLHYIKDNKNYYATNYKIQIH